MRKVLQQKTECIAIAMYALILVSFPFTYPQRTLLYCMQKGIIIRHDVQYKGSIMHQYDSSEFSSGSACIHDIHVLQAILSSSSKRK